MEVGPSITNLSNQQNGRMTSERDSLTVSTLACHAADPGSNPAQGDDFFN